LKLACSFTVALALAMLPGCGTSISGMCEDTCDCTGDCSPNDEEDCVDDLEDIERDAAAEGCEEQFDEALSCLDDEFACRGGAVDADGCNAEVDNLDGCVGFGTGLRFWNAFAH
jgi:hypothetical protein